MDDNKKMKRRSFSNSERAEILKKTGKRCAHCGCRLTPETMTVEHIFPIVKGGTHDEFNLTALCETCNFAKSDGIYDISDYYRFIIPMYVEQFEEQLVRFKARFTENKNILTEREKVFYVIPRQCKIMVAKMAIQGGQKNKKRIAKLIENSKTKLVMERAYEAESQEILDFINGVDGILSEKIDTSVYDNIYKIRNVTKYGQAYTLRYCDKICGVFMFEKLKDNDIDFVQLNNIVEHTGYQKQYICTLAITNRMAYDAYDDIMFYFFYRMLIMGKLPIYFNVLEATGNESDVIKLPFEVNGCQGTADFFTYRGLKNYLKERIVETESEGLFDKEDVEDIIDRILYNFDENEEDKELTLKIREQLLKQ